jgi:hypothetical protein
MSAVDWQAMEGSGEQTAQCALLDELIDQTARLTDEQRTANLIALLAVAADRYDGMFPADTVIGLRDEISERFNLGSPS